ncbi:hypothetical protein PR048_004939 [Dryococelus australis]|uniref:Uncharacterized protein n=1 Tax=Dryococelus australis TaxID=614101 RepID=A0ABQ9I7W0_9NEOP|nr:hypothetical protein PR048_004939 [Dryococelus australis]
MRCDEPSTQTMHATNRNEEQAGHKDRYVNPAAEELYFVGMKTEQCIGETNESMPPAGTGTRRPKVFTLRAGRKGNKFQSAGTVSIQHTTGTEIAQTDRHISTPRETGDEEGRTQDHPLPTPTSVQLATHHGQGDMIGQAKITVNLRDKISHTTADQDAVIDMGAALVHVGKDRETDGVRNWTLTTPTSGKCQSGRFCAQHTRHTPRGHTMHLPWKRGVFAEQTRYDQ